MERDAFRWSSTIAKVKKTVMTPTSSTSTQVIDARPALT
jgi:hypothetical protein